MHLASSTHTWVHPTNLLFSHALMPTTKQVDMDRAQWPPNAPELAPLSALSLQRLCLASVDFLEASPAATASIWGLEGLQVGGGHWGGIWASGAWRGIWASGSWRA